MSIKCVLELKGHILDSLILSKVMDYINELGAKCSIETIDVGEKATNLTYAKLIINAPSNEIMQKAIEHANKNGAIASCEEEK